MFQESSPFLGGPDFSSLAEGPKPPPEKSPEILDDDDDDVVVEKPKTLIDFLKDKPAEEDAKKDASKIEKEDTSKKESSGEDESDEAEPSTEEESEDPEVIEASEPTPEEEPLIVADYSEKREPEISAEKQGAEPGSEQAVKAQASEDFHKTLNEEVAAGKTLDEALPATEAKVTGVDSSESPETEPSEPVSVEEEPIEPEEPAAELPPVPPETVPPPEDIVDDDPAIPASPPTPPTVPPVPPHVPGGPLGPGRPGGPGGRGPGGPGAGGPGGPGVAGGNVLAAAPNLAPTNTINIDRTGRRINTGGAVLAGGLVGYLLGRRRGRIKTENKLLPIQHRLEKQVADMQQKIAWREMTVRNSVWEQFRAKREQDMRLSAEAENQQTAEHRVNQEQRSAEAEKAQDRHAERPRQVEQAPLLAHPEKLGKFAVDTERASQSEAFRAPERLKPVDAMTVPELLEVAERIKIQESTVKRLHETNRLNDEGLRRVIRAFLRGERYDQIITDNLQTPEKYPYPETLQRNVVPADQLHGASAGMSPSFMQQPPPGGSSANWTDPSQAPAQADAYQPQTAQTPKQTNYTGVVVAGVVLAVVILIFLLTR